MPTKPDPIPLQKQLGLAVKTIRAEKALTQEDLSRAAGLHVTYISDIERGARNPSFAVLVRIADGLDITMADLGAAFDRTPKS